MATAVTTTTTTTTITTAHIEAPAPFDTFSFRYNLALEEERARRSRAWRITAESASKRSGPQHAGKTGSCIHCSNVATVDILLHFRDQMSSSSSSSSLGGEIFEWAILEKYCDSCAKSHYPEAVMATSCPVPVMEEVQNKAI